MELIQKYYRPQRFLWRREVAGILLIILVFLLFPYGIRLLDVTAAPIDSGILSVIILAVCALLIFKAVTWWLIRTIWPVLANYSSDHFENDFKSLKPWQKVIIYLAFYGLLLFSFILSLLALT